MEQGQNISITFVDTYRLIRSQVRIFRGEDPYVFMVVAPYSLKEKFETPDTHADI